MEPRNASRRGEDPCLALLKKDRKLPVNSEGRQGRWIKVSGEESKKHSTVGGERGDRSVYKLVEEKSQG